MERSIVSDEREKAMLALMEEANQLLRQTHNLINELWAEWTRTHSSTVMKNVPLPSKAVKRVLR
jgi:hypothetical protein